MVLLLLLLAAELQLCHVQFFGVRSRANYAAWGDLLASQISQTWTGSVFKCPSYRGVTVRFPDNLDGYIVVNIGSYGWNGSGVNGNPYPPTEADYSLGSCGRAVKPSAVRVPSDMIAFGDGNPFFKPAVSSANGIWKLEARETIFAYDFLSWMYGRQVSWVPEYRDKVWREISYRHNGAYNMTFLDGHVEGIKHEQLFARDPRAARRWNTDNEPHLDLAPAD